MKKALTAVLIVALLAVFGYSAYRIGDYLLEMRRSEKDTQEAAKYVEVPHVEDRDLNDMIYPDKLKNEFLVNFEELWKIICVSAEMLMTSAMLAASWLKRVTAFLTMS